MPPESPSIDTKICPKCGSSFPVEPVFCKNCGTRLIQIYAQQHGAKYWLDLGDKYLKNRQYDEAIKSFEELLKLNPNDFQAWKKIGDAHYKNFQFDLSISAYNKALEGNPDDIEILFNKATLFEHQNLAQKEEAVNILYKLLKTNQNLPNLLPDILLSLAFELTCLERFDESYESYQQFKKISQERDIGGDAENEDLDIDEIDKRVKTANIWETFAYCLKVSENYEEAIFAIENSIKYDAERLDLGKILQRANLFHIVGREDQSKPYPIFY